MSWSSFGLAWVDLGAPRGRPVHSGSNRLCMVVVGFIRVCVQWLVHSGSRVHSLLRCGIRSGLGVFALIRVRVGSIGRAYVSSVRVGSLGRA